MNATLEVSSNIQEPNVLTHKKHCFNLLPIHNEAGDAILGLGHYIRRPDLFSATSCSNSP